MITIIVLLILAMTSVSLVLRNNLINKALSARNVYEQASQEESDTLDEFETKVNEIFSDKNDEETKHPNEYGFYEDVVYQLVFDNTYNEIYIKFNINDINSDEVTMYNKVEGEETQSYILKLKKISAYNEGTEYEIQVPTKYSLER